MNINEKVLNIGDTRDIEYKWYVYFPKLMGMYEQPQQ